tara:strand:+ start:617 stop:763 length:147 start_codon:yes stop_codon:yes gene_type:complete
VAPSPVALLQDGTPYAMPPQTQHAALREMGMSPAKILTTSPILSERRG